MSQEYRRLNGSTPMQVYTKIAFIGILVCIAYAVLSKGEFIRYLTWTGETAGIYPDLFESVRDAANHYPYDWKAIYPPLIYTVLYSSPSWFRVTMSHWAALLMRPKRRTACLLARFS